MVSILIGSSEGRRSSGVVHLQNLYEDYSSRYLSSRLKDISEVHCRHKSVNIVSSPFDQFKTRVFLRRLDRKSQVRVLWLSTLG